VRGGAFQFLGGLVIQPSRPFETFFRRRHQSIFSATCLSWVYSSIE
jgi:hypothetical protein